MIKAGFSRDTSNTLSNLIALLVVALTFRLTSLITRLGMVPSLIGSFSALTMVYLFNLIVFSQSPYLYSVTASLSQILIAAKNMVLYIYLYQFPLHGFTGMYTTFLLSVWNFGEMRTLHTLIISTLGWRICAFLGVLIQIIIIFKFPALIAWVERGTVDLDSSILEDTNVGEESDEMMRLSIFVKE